jgi:hypothetical protein
MIELMVRREPWADGVSLSVRDQVGRNFQVPKLVWEDHVDGMLVEPVMRFSNAQATNLMDELWAAGVRPSDGTGSTGQLAATQAHLQDMRTLVFSRKEP